MKVIDDPRSYVVDSATGCWVWQRCIQSGGYAKAWIDGRRCLAHRVFYERAHGPIPDGLELDHLCRNRACVNPDHLEAVTSAENTRRGRPTKLTAAQVVEIRAASGLTLDDLARRYGVSAPQISLIRRGLSWKVAS